MTSGPSALNALGANPAVTVVVPVYKGGDWVRHAIDSLLAQTYVPLRILVVCDGSPLPGDQRLGSDYAGRIDFVMQANSGLCATLNRAISQWIDTPLMARLDQDDIAHPTRIAQQVAALRDGAADACFTRINKFVRPGRVLAVHPEDSAALYAYDPDRHGAIVHSTLLASTGFLRQLGSYRAELYPCDDFDLCLRMSRAGKVIVVGGAPLVDYRIHEQANTFGQFWQMQLRSRYLEWAHGNNQCDVSFAQWYAQQGRQETAGVAARIEGLGRLYYRRAGVMIGSGRPVAGGGLLAVSTILNPGFALQRLRIAARTVLGRKARS